MQASKTHRRPPVRRAAPALTQLVPPLPPDYSDDPVTRFAFYFFMGSVVVGMIIFLLLPLFM